MNEKGFKDLQALRARIESLLRYESESGEFYWLESRGSKKAGQKAGSLDSKGYVQIRVDGHAWYAHRLAWMLVKGQYPDFQIDHKDTCRNNNSISNLRASTVMQNGYNRSKQMNNKSGVKGVHWNKKRNKWCAVVGVNRLKVHVGYFECLDRAEIAIRAKRNELHKEFSRD